MARSTGSRGSRWNAPAGQYRPCGESTITLAGVYSSGAADPVSEGTDSRGAPEAFCSSAMSSITTPRSPSSSFPSIFAHLGELLLLLLFKPSSLNSRKKLRTGRAVRKLSTTERFPATLLLRGAHECLGSHHEARGLPPRAFLPAASREPVDRGSGGAGLGRPLPRLERADRRGVLRPERRGPAQERQRPHLRHRQQLRPPLLQLRPDAPRLARAADAGDLSQRFGGGRAQPPATRARERHRAGLQPRHPAALQRARPAHPDPLGHRRLQAPVRAGPRGHVAAGDRRRRADAAGAARRRHPIHGALPLSVPAGPRSGRPVARCCRRAFRSHPAPRRSAAFGNLVPGVLLRRPDRARGGVRRGPGERRRPGSQAGGRLLRCSQARGSAGGRGRWRDVRPPPQGRRRGPGGRHPQAVAARGHPARQSGTGPGAVSAHPGGRDLRRLVLELRPWHRALAQRLRLLDQWAAGLEAAVARPAARGAGWTAGPARRRVRAGSGQAAARSLAGPRRVHRGAPGPGAPKRPRVPGAPRGSRARAGGARQGAAAAGDAAANDAHVHQLRVVLRRGLGAGDGADPEVRGPRAAAGPRSLRGRVGGLVQDGAGARALEHSGARERAAGVRAGGATQHRHTGDRRGPLCDRRPGGGLPPQGPDLLPRRPDQLPAPRGRRDRRALGGAHRDEEPDHPGAARPHHLRAALLRGRLPLRRPPLRRRSLRPHRGAAVRVVQPAVARAGGARDRPRVPRTRIHPPRPLPRRAPRGRRQAPAGDDGAVRRRLSTDLRRQPPLIRLPARDRLPGPAAAAGRRGRGRDPRGGGRGPAARRGQARSRARPGRAPGAEAAGAAPRGTHRPGCSSRSLPGGGAGPLRARARGAPGGGPASRRAGHARHAPRHALRSVEHPERILGRRPRGDLAARRRGPGPARAGSLVRRDDRARSRGWQPRAGLCVTTPIQDYAIVGDGRSAALISRGGSLDWLCWPRFDSPSVFAAILDEDRGGRFTIAPRRPFRSERAYLCDTNVLRTRFFALGGELTLTDFMPVYTSVDARSHPHGGHELVRIARCERGEVELQIVFDPRPEFALLKPEIGTLGKLGLRLDTGRGRLLTLLTDAPLGPEGEARIRIRSGEELHFSLGYANCAPATLPPPTAERCALVLEETLRLWREWASRTRYEGPARDLVVRSALLLKLLQYAPSGAIVAAPTTSLPERPGGDLNWDYRFCWLRDAALTARAPFGLGHIAEADTFMSWLLNATSLSLPKLRVLYDLFGRRPGR